MKELFQMRSSKTIFFTLAIISALSISKDLHAKVMGSIEAVVNDTIITTADVDRAMAARSLKADQKNLSRKDVIDKLIDDEVLNQSVQAAKIDVSDDDIAKAIAQILHRNRMTLAQLKGDLTSKGITYEEYKAEIVKGIKRDKFLGQNIGPQVKISDQDLRDYYQRHQEQFRSSLEAHIAQISWSLLGIKSQAEFDILSQAALAMVEKLKHGSAIDKAIAQANTSPIPTGGDLGMVNINKLTPEMAQLVKSMTTGEVSNPIITKDSLVIIKLIALPEISNKDFDRLRDDIYNRLYDEKINETLQSYLQNERQKAFIEIRTQK